MQKTIDERLAWVIEMLTDFDLHKVNKGDVVVPLGVCVNQLNKIIEVVQKEIDQKKLKQS